MALGRRRSEQQEAWIATTDLPRSPGHPFYRQLNKLLAEADFDRWVEQRCGPYYDAVGRGRPSIPPGTYFRMIFVGYFEGIGSQRGIAWRCSDSRSLAEFLGIPITQATPDHSSLTRVHQRLPLDVHEEVFQFVLKIAAEKNLLKGKKVAVDSTTLEANAAMKSIVRKDSGEDWNEYLKRLADEAGIEDPTAEELRRFDKGRKKKVPNDEWESPTDRDSRITKMKDGTTHLAYKAEHVVDLDSEFVLAATVHGGDAGDSQTMVDSVLEAQGNLDAAHDVRRERERDEKKNSPVEIEEVAADKAYHSDEALELCQALGLRTYIPEREQRQQRRWTDKPASYQHAVYANRRRVQREKSKRLQRQRSERVERSFAHVCDTGGGRRCWLRGLSKVTKRYLLQVAARNLGLLLRKLFGIGTAKSLQGSFSFICLIYTVASAISAIGAIGEAIRTLRAAILTRRCHWHPPPTACQMWG
jgi:transposase